MKSALEPLLEALDVNALHSTIALAGSDKGIIWVIIIAKTNAASVIRIRRSVFFGFFFVLLCNLV